MTRHWFDRRWRLAAVAAVLLVAGCASTQPAEPAAQAGSVPGLGPHHHGARGHGGHAAQGHGGHRHGGHGSVHAAVIGDGRSLSAAGHTLAGLTLAGSRLSFRVENPAGKPLTDFATTHTKRLHMFVFATDLTDFRHVHPEMGPAGRWEMNLPSLSAGSHRVVAEFQPRGRQSSILLGGAVEAPGQRPARPLPPPDTEVRVDGYAVTLAADQVAGGRTLLQVKVTDSTGGPVALRPYLGSWAHAVLVHSGTFAVTHLHPLEVVDGHASSPSALTLDAPPVEPGNYRLFVEFATADGNHQAGFTIPATR